MKNVIEFWIVVTANPNPVAPKFALGVEGTRVFLTECNDEIYLFSSKQKAEEAKDKMKHINLKVVAFSL